MLGAFIYSLSTDEHRRQKDQYELGSIFARYGTDAVTVLKARAADRSIETRDRKHWRRLVRAARYFNVEHAVNEATATAPRHTPQAPS